MPFRSKDHGQPKSDLNPVEINTNDPVEIARRGWAFYYRQDYPSAVESFLEALRFNPDEIDFLYGLALTYKLMGKTGDAIQTFEKIQKRIEFLDDRVKATVLKRLVMGHINQIKQGDWNLGELVWQKKD